MDDQTHEAIPIKDKELWWPQGGHAWPTPMMHRARARTFSSCVGAMSSPVSGLPQWGIPSLSPSTVVRTLRLSLPTDFEWWSESLELQLLGLQQLSHEFPGFRARWSTQSMTDQGHACKVIQELLRPKASSFQPALSASYLYVGATEDPVRRWNEEHCHRFGRMVLVQICDSPAAVITMERFLASWAEDSFPGRLVNVGPGGEHIRRTPKPGQDMKAYYTYVCWSALFKEC